MSTRSEKLAFAREMVAKIEAQLLDSVGVSSIGTDGLAVTVDPELERKLERWRKQVARYSRPRSRTTTVNLANADD
jgi:hypothetical protein